MEHIRKIAWVSVARGCGFGALAIFTLMIGFVTTPALALDFGGIGFLLMAVILMIKAFRSDRLPHNHTEIWLMLEPEQRPPPDVASVVIMRTRREVILRFAYMSALTALCCLAPAAALQIAGFR
jgi:hypothetical protein